MSKNLFRKLPRSIDSVDNVDKSVHNPNFKPNPVWMKLWMCSYLSNHVNQTYLIVVFYFIFSKYPAAACKHARHAALDQFSAFPVFIL
jgi:hypothetical protein